MRYSGGMTFPLEKIEVLVDELTFDVAISGPADGTPVMLLHGFPEGAESWSAVTPSLHTAGFKTIVPDQRGYSAGARPTDVNAYRIECLVADIIGMLNALELNRIHLVGHDWGSVVGWFVAERYPDRLKTFTAVSSPHPAAFGWALLNDTDQQQRSGYFRLFRTVNEAERTLLADNGTAFLELFGDAIPAERAEAYLSRHSKPGALTGGLNWYRAMTRDFADLEPISIPTTYVWSDEDFALGRAGAVRCGDHVRADYEFVVAKGVSHWVPEQEPSLVADAILQRISRYVD